MLLMAVPGEEEEGDLLPKGVEGTLPWSLLDTVLRANKL